MAPFRRFATTGGPHEQALPSTGQWPSDHPCDRAGEAERAVDRHDLRSARPAGHARPDGARAGSSRSPGALLPAPRAGGRGVRCRPVRPRRGRRVRAGTQAESGGTEHRQAPGAGDGHRQADGRGVRRGAASLQASRGGHLPLLQGRGAAPRRAGGRGGGRAGVGQPRMVRTRPPVSKRAAEAEAGGEPPANAYTPPMLAKLFDFPAGDGAGQCVAVLAFNGEGTKGGYEPSALESYFTDTLKQAAPKLTDVVVQGPGNDPGDGSEAKRRHRRGAARPLHGRRSRAGGGRGGVLHRIHRRGVGERDQGGGGRHDQQAESDLLLVRQPRGRRTEGRMDRTGGEAGQRRLRTGRRPGDHDLLCLGRRRVGRRARHENPARRLPRLQPWVLGCGGIRLEADPATGDDHLGKGVERPRQERGRHGRRGEPPVRAPRVAGCRRRPRQRRQKRQNRTRRARRRQPRRSRNTDVGA